MPSEIHPHPHLRKRTLLPRPRMIRGRMVLLLLAYAAGGAIINVAVAWGLIRFVRPEVPFMPMMPDDRWIGIQPFTDTSEEITFTQQSAPGIINWYGRGSLYGVTVDIVQTGWPIKALEGGMWIRTKPIGGQSRVVGKHYEAGWPMTFGVRHRFLPLRPILPGFAINTIFYAAMIRGLWLLFAAPGFVRRRIRARRGQCPACAYPIGASDVCTECGAAVESRIPRPVVE